jgi:hypothetical protein
MHDRRRIVGHAEHQRAVRGQRAHHHGGRIDHLDRAGGGLAILHQRGHAPGHRIALDRFVAPALDIVDDVVSREVVAVGPFNALADVQRVLGGVVVDFPAFQQHRPQRAIAADLDEVFDDAAGLVAKLGPVIGARVLQFAAVHLDAQRAAHRRRGVFALRQRRAVEAKRGIGRRGGGAERGRPAEEFAPAHLPGDDFAGIHLDGRMHTGSGRSGITHGVRFSLLDACLYGWAAPQGTCGPEAEAGWKGPVGRPLSVSEARFDPRRQRGWPRIFVRKRHRPVQKTTSRAPMDAARRVHAQPRRWMLISNFGWMFDPITPSRWLL